MLCLCCLDCATLLDCQLRALSAVTLWYRVSTCHILFSRSLSCLAGDMCLLSCSALTVFSLLVMMWLSVWIFGTNLSTTPIRYASMNWSIWSKELPLPAYAELKTAGWSSLTSMDVKLSISNPTHHLSHMMIELCGRFYASSKCVCLWVWKYIRCESPLWIFAIPA